MAAGTLAPVRRAIAAVGRTLVTAGILILLFVAYQLWGTNILEARAQDDLEREFATLQEEYGEGGAAGAGDAGAGTGSTDGDGTSGDGTGTSSAEPDATEPVALPPLPDFGGGDAVGIIEIPEIGVTKVFVEGTDAEDLKKGPGHYAGTPMPGQIGNAAIAGHRTTYGAPFHRLDELAPGDEIITTTLEGRFVYRVREQRVVGPRDVWVVANTPEPQLTLTTCHPKYSARERLVVWADLVVEESAEPTAAEPTTTTTAPSLPSEDVSEDDSVAALTQGLEGTQRSLGPTWGWGAVVTLVGLGWWWLFRRWRHPFTWLLGVGPFLVFLFVFYIYLERLLPANY